MPYEFTQEGFRDFSQKIIDAKGDQATVTSILAEMQDTFNDNIGRLTKLESDNQSITAENERLRNANMDLFLRIGATQESVTKGQPTPTQEKPMSTAEYMENYFKEEK